MAGNATLQSKNFKVRCASAAVITSTLIGFGLLGGWFWFAYAAAISFMGIWEFYHLFGIEKTPFMAAGFGLTACVWLFVAMDRSGFLLPLVITAFLIFMAIYVLRFEKTQAQEAMAALTGFIYLPILLTTMVRLRLGVLGGILIWLVFIGSWGSDTGAYFGGVLFGKHKMAPVLSPKKTWEGAVGGVLAAVVLGTVFGLIFREKLAALRVPVLFCGLACGISSIVSMIGDLTASAYKRSFGLKDYSNLIPGHGGILDRFDSVIFVAPVIYYLTRLFLM